MLSFSLHNSNMKMLLVVLLSAITVSGQETVYGMQMPSFSSSSGPSGNSGSNGMGWDSLGLAGGSSGGATGRGRVVSNSILDLDEPNEMELENENMEMVFRPQTSVFPMMMANRPVMTGPSIATGQMLEPTRTPGGNGIGMTGAGTSANSNGISNNKVHRYVSVHVPPPEPMLSPRPSQATPKVKPETHYQILFIKAPSSIPQEVQQIQLPPPPQMKTLVYVLLKRDSMSDLLKISKAPKAKPAKPEVFFIRYKDQKSQQPQDEQKSQTGDLMMTSNGNINVNNGIRNNNEEGTKPRITSTTSRPSENRGMEMVPPKDSGPSVSYRDRGVTGVVGMMQATGVTGQVNRGMGMTQAPGGMGMIQASGAYGPMNGGNGWMGPQASGVTGPVNRGMGMAQASGGPSPANKIMGMVQSSGGSGASNTGMQMGMTQALGGYGNAEIADSDFSSDFNENKYLQAYRRQRQQQQNQRQVRSGFTFLPSRRYGIVY